jgi:hypothetical protein
MQVETILWTGPAAADVPVSNQLVWAPAQGQGPQVQNPVWSRDLPAYLHKR